MSGVRSSRAWPTTCAEPVLPQTSIVASRARKPVPSATTRRMPSLTTAIVSGRTSGAPGGSAAMRAKWGRTRRPPLAMNAATRAIWSGVALTWPCPIATETVSPPYQGVFSTRSFHSALGISPLASAGRSTPVGAPSPISLAHLASRAISSRIPTW